MEALDNIRASLTYTNSFVIGLITQLYNLVLYFGKKLEKMKKDDRK